MSSTHNSLRIVGLMAGLIICALSAQAANWQPSGGVVSGNWNDPTHWDTNNVPDTAAESARSTSVLNPQNGPHTITLNELM